MAAAAAGSASSSFELDDSATYDDGVYLNTGVWKRVLSAAPPGAEAVTPFARVTVTYCISVAAWPGNHYQQGSSGLSPSGSGNGSPNSSTEDYYYDPNTGSTSHFTNAQRSSNHPPPPLREYVETENVVEKRDDMLELHITGCDPLTPLMPGLDVAVASMAVGEESLFIVSRSRSYGECSSPPPGSQLAADAVLAIVVKVHSMMREIDLSEEPGQRMLVKHIIRHGKELSGAGTQSPQLYATVRYAVQELHPLTGQWTKMSEVEAQLGGRQTAEWLDRVMTTMLVDEFCTILVGGKSTYRVLLKAFANLPVPRDVSALDLATQLRLEGNAMFGDKHPKCYSTYLAALHYTQAHFYPTSLSALEEPLIDLRYKIHQNCGLVLIRQKECEKAAQHFSAAIELTATAPKFKLFFNRAKAYRQLKDYKSASADLSRTEQLLTDMQAAGDTFTVTSSPTTAGASPTMTVVNVGADLARLREEMAMLEADQEAVLLAQIS